MKLFCRFLLACLCVAPLWAASFQQPLAFVGRDHVDLYWPEQTGYDFYRVYRDGTAVSPDIPASDADAGFYRDASLNEGTTHTYQLGAFRIDGAEEWSTTQSATVGEIRGLLYRDLTWNVGDYSLIFDVQVAPGVILRIEKPAVVKRLVPTGTVLKLTDEPGGTILISGGTIEVPADLHQPASACNHATFNYPGTLSLRGHAGPITLIQNLFSEFTLVTISGSAPITLTANQFVCSTLTAALQADLELVDTITADGKLASWDVAMPAPACASTESNTSANSSRRVRLLSLHVS